MNGDEIAAQMAFNKMHEDIPDRIIVGDREQRAIAPARAMEIFDPRSSSKSFMAAIHPK